MARQQKVPGTIYLNGRRYWWKVRLPGEDRPRARPLKPMGAQYATKDKAVALQVARRLWRRAVAEAGSVHRPNTIAELVAAYTEHARIYYKPKPGAEWQEGHRISAATTPLIERYGTLPPEDFGPLALKEVRQAMISAGLARKTINDRIGLIKRIFKWAASEEIAPAGVYEALRTVDGLRAGRSEAKETKPVKPVAEEWVRKTMEFMPPTLAAMVEVHLQTGMRSGELCTMRPCDVNRQGKVWLYTPSTHKTAHHGFIRVVPIGPKAQRVLKPVFERAAQKGTQSYVFPPAVVEQERNRLRRANRKTPLWPSHERRLAAKRKPDRAKPPGERYDATSYRKAIGYAIRWARKAGVDVPDWTPHQLRHTAATKIRREKGLDAARAMLGHRTLAVTDTYAELDQALAVETARELG